MGVQTLQTLVEAFRIVDDQTMTQADQIKRLKRQLEKARAERDGALKNFRQAVEATKKDDAKLNDNAGHTIT
ncbi:MAG: hypothetical protein IS632_08640 [Thaumarchaeota archaeon]|nr:hypothetical protein [Nitrososphaerota archaeon]